MYEFHCWIQLRNQLLDRESEKDLITDAQFERRFKEGITKLKKKLHANYGFYHPIFEQKRKRREFLNKFIPFFKIPSDQSQHDSYKIFGSGGGTYTTVHFSGLRNHKGSYDTELEILEWIMINLPYSYGLLYLRNEESSEHPDEFVVYRLAKNKITKLEDHYLSPYFDEVDNGYYED